MQLRTVPANFNQHLLVLRPDRYDGNSPVLQLLQQQPGRQFRRASADQNAIERRFLGPTQRAVTMSKMHVTNLHFHQPLPRLIQQRFQSFDAVYLTGKLREDGGLVSAPGPDLQDLVINTDIQPLGHERDHVRLADRLAVPDRSGAIGERLVLGSSREKSIARHPAQCRDHPLVADSPLDHLLLDHRFQSGYFFYVIHSVRHSTLLRVYRRCHLRLYLEMPAPYCHLMRPATSSRPIITLTSDFGLSDIYVAAMKAVLLQHCPDATLIDITHNVPRQDILCGSITLERAIDGFPSGTTHLAVVDPGVGTQRRLIVAKIKDSVIVCPDNGLITWAWRLHSSPTARHLTWRPARYSNTFHGRDIMAPVAGMLAAGTPIDKLSTPMDSPVLLKIAPAPDAHRGEVIHIDHFGNATTNIAAELLKPAKTSSIRIHRRSIGKLKRTYWDVAPGKPIALIGSSGLLEIAVRDGSAAEELKIRVGDAVRLS